jgi:ABC-type antimicrobial peptide transport system permease subunit
MNRLASATLRDIFDGLRSQPGRVGLSALAIAVGIVALTVLLAVLGGLRARAERMIQELGVNVIALAYTEPADDKQARQPLHARHLDLLAANLPGSVVSGYRQYAQVPTMSAPAPLTVIATDERLFRIRNWPVVAGRALDQTDLERRESYAVVSRALSTRNNWNPGQVITLERIPFQLVGVVEVGGAPDEDGGASFVGFGEEVVFVPRTLPPYWEGSFRVPDGALDAILIQVPEAAALAPTLARAQRLMAQPDQQASGLSWITPELLIRKIKRLQDTIKITVGSIALLCLILGGTTLMSLMVANVRDRVTEIGLRRALGATPGDIAQLFVLEACLVTAAAAVAGALLTHLLLWMAAPRLPVPVELGWTSLLVPLAAALVLGMGFSYWPARSAARIAPSEALRNE